MTQILELPSPIWETWIELLAPAFCLVETWPLDICGSGQTHCTWKSLATPAASGQQGSTIIPGQNESGLLHATTLDVLDKGTFHSALVSLAWRTGIG